MKPPRRYLILDYESRGSDLKKIGSYEYAQTAEILCVAWRVGTRKELKTAKTRVWSPFISPGVPFDLVLNLRDDAVMKVAHNAFFEQVITRFVLAELVQCNKLRNIPSSQWLCTAATAAAVALPRKLEHACEALNLTHQKDMEGHRLMLKMSKPRKPTKDDKSKWHEGPEDFKRLMQYCVADLDAEVELFLSIPPLSHDERKVWELDQKINFRGFNVDRELVTKALDMIDTEVERLHVLTNELTKGRVPKTTQRAVLQKWLARKGTKLPNMQKKTIQDALDAGLVTGVPAEVLRIRQDVSRTSTQKYKAFELRTRTDSIVRDSLRYCAASTGRWGGSGVQPHNFPRGTYKDGVDEFDFDLIRQGDVELIRMLYGSPMEFLSNCLRGMIVAPEGEEFFCADFASIEVRVLFWLADHANGLHAFRNDLDLYTEMASVIYGVPIKAVTKEMRDVGKRAILGCGYGMGSTKFRSTCHDFGQEITEALASKSVKAYRRLHAPVTKMWNDTEAAAIKAVRTGKRVTSNKCTWFTEGKYLYCELPGGRRLAYYGPKIKWIEDPWGNRKPVLYHWDVHPKTKKWVFVGTYGGRLVENITQAVARDFMVSGMQNAEAAKYKIRLTVHDELLGSRKKGRGSVSEFEKLMAKKLPWGKGCPVVAKGYKGIRYKK